MVFLDLDLGFSFGFSGWLPFLIQRCTREGLQRNLIDKGLKTSDKGPIYPTRESVPILKGLFKAFYALHWPWTPDKDFVLGSSYWQQLFT
ncbi:MAG: hypothetical protein NVS9B7_28600 [Flavisolibacter sp.]